MPTRPKLIGVYSPPLADADGRGRLPVPRDFKGRPATLRAAVPKWQLLFILNKAMRTVLTGVQDGANVTCCDLTEAAILRRRYECPQTKNS